MEAKYTIKADTTDLVMSEEGQKIFSKAHGPFTGFVVIGFSKDEEGDDCYTVMMHDVNAVTAAAAISSHKELRMIATLATMGSGKGGLLGMLGGEE